jgi:hypothetical protein
MITVALGLTLVAACGNSTSASNSPHAVHSALQATANQSGLQLTLSLKGSPSTFANNGSSTLTPAQEQAILASQVNVTVVPAPGTTLASAGSGGQLALAVTQGGNSVVEVRVTGKPPTLYARVDVAKLSSAYGLDKGKVAQFRSELEKLGTQVTGLQALDNDQWVSLDVNALSTLAAAAGITLPSAPQVVARIVGAFFNQLNQAANIQPTAAGQAQLTVNSQQLVSGLAQAVAATPGVSGLNKQASSLPQRAQNAVPARSATVIVTVGGGIVSNLQLSLNQFDTAHHLNGPASANLAVSKAGSVPTPSGATPINLGQLIHALQGSAAGS